MSFSMLKKKGVDKVVVSLLKRIVKQVPWPDRRLAKADVVSTLLNGKVRTAEAVFGWGRGTLEIGMDERVSGKRHLDDIGNRRKPTTEERLPCIEQDIRSLFESKSQADARLGTTLRYLNASASNVRSALMEHGYSEDELPTVRTVSNMLNRMGFRLRAVQKAKPQKKRLKQT
jgi:hypothetical protein